ncbi:MAG TPA: DUF192 domain-containing protein [Syntrophomonadaceae bacterium]|nr:DUF192 domain-containing protein [Syntrophomonadaceae bacterium]HPR92800.1 DUF192 domain-containing protein [Syntrophomonadaceae bacterium]
MMGKVCCRVYKAKNKALIAYRVEAAVSFISRLRGLLGRKNMPAGCGLLLRPCSSVHCFGMRFPIDVIFLDRHNRVINIREKMNPGSWASESQACCVLELRAGEVRKHKIDVGDQLLLSFTSFASSSEHG